MLRLGYVSGPSFPMIQRLSIGTEERIELEKNELWDTEKQQKK